MYSAWSRAPGLSAAKFPFTLCCVCLERSNLRHAEVRQNCQCFSVFCSAARFISQIKRVCDGALANDGNTDTRESLQVGGNLPELRLCAAHNQKGRVTGGAAE